MLPMRRNNAYPEVEASFRQLRRVFKAALPEAYANSAFETHDRLEMTSATKKRVAPNIVTQRFLAMVDKAS
jgi:hypothetical protein